MCLLRAWKRLTASQGVTERSPGRGKFPANSNEQTQISGMTMMTFLRRLAMHYGIYRRYPLAPLPALKNAWRISR
jgi:hypothetical protein